jgi:hypothetical protein
MLICLVTLEVPCTLLLSQPPCKDTIGHRQHLFCHLFGCVCIGVRIYSDASLLLYGVLEHMACLLCSGMCRTVV